MLGKQIRERSVLGYDALFGSVKYGGEFQKSSSYQDIVIAINMSFSIYGHRRELSKQVSTGYFKCICVRGEGVLAILETCLCSEITNVQREGGVV